MRSLRCSFATILSNCVVPLRTMGFDCEPSPSQNQADISGSYGILCCEFLRSFFPQKGITDDVLLLIGKEPNAFLTVFPKFPNNHQFICRWFFGAQLLQNGGIAGGLQWRVMLLPFKTKPPQRQREIVLEGTAGFVKIADQTRKVAFQELQKRCLRIIGGVSDTQVGQSMPNSTGAETIDGATKSAEQCNVNYSGCRFCL
jgi:hypothetical protein